MNQTPLATDNTRPGTVSFIDGSYRIAWVGTRTDKTGEFHSQMKWYLPKTREDRGIVNRFRQSLMGTNYGKVLV